MLKVVNVGAFVSIEAFLQADERHVYVGRLTPLGNPFKVPRRASDRVRAVCKEKYRGWLWEKVKARDRRVMNALKSIRPDSILGCWCTPKPSCHAEVISRCLEWMWENPDALK